MITSRQQDPKLLSREHDPALLCRQQSPTLISNHQGPTLLSRQQVPTLLSRYQGPTLFSLQQGPTLLSRQLHRGVICHRCHCHRRWLYRHRTTYLSLHRSHHHLRANSPHHRLRFPRHRLGFPHYCACLPCRHLRISRRFHRFPQPHSNPGRCPRLHFPRPFPRLYHLLPCHLYTLRASSTKRS